MAHPVYKSCLVWPDTYKYESLNFNFENFILTLYSSVRTYIPSAATGRWSVLWSLCCTGSGMALGRCLCAQLLPLGSRLTRRNNGGVVRRDVAPHPRSMVALGTLLPAPRPSPSIAAPPHSSPRSQQPWVVSVCWQLAADAGSKCALLGRRRPDRDNGQLRARLGRISDETRGHSDHF